MGKESNARSYESAIGDLNMQELGHEVTHVGDHWEDPMTLSIVVLCCAVLPCSLPSAQLDQAEDCAAIGRYNCSA